VPPGTEPGLTDTIGEIDDLVQLSGLDQASALERIGGQARRRRIPLPGTLNLRDVGGYPTGDGRSVRWRVLLRSDALHRVRGRTAVLRELNLRTVIDLRSHVEAEIAPSDLGDLGARTLHISVLGGDFPALPADLSGTYQHIVDECGAAIGSVIQRLCAPGALPALLHCSAGKDRTGIVIALILATIGVPDDVVAADYDLSGSRPELILDVLARVRGQAGSVDGYLIRHGLEAGGLATLRAALVE
jgi:Tyrosine phosphatase family